MLAPQHCRAPCSVPWRRQLCPPTAASATSRCHAGWQALPSALCLPRPGIPPAQSNPCMMQLPCSMMPCCKVRYTWRPPRHPTSRQLEMNLVFVHSLSSHVRCSDTTPAVDCGPGQAARRTACLRNGVYLKSTEVTPAAGAALSPHHHDTLDWQWSCLSPVSPQPSAPPANLYITVLLPCSVATSRKACRDSHSLASASVPAAIGRHVYCLLIPHVRRSLQCAPKGVRLGRWAFDDHAHNSRSRHNAVSFYSLK